MPAGILEYVINSREWGRRKVCQPIPLTGNPWGSLAGLKDTALAKHIPVVSGTAVSHAKHGWATPLMREVGPLPHRLISRFQQRGWPCAYKVDQSCIMARPECRPGKDAPVCYEPDVPKEHREAAAFVMRMWAEGVLVFVVSGGEHSLK